MTTPAAILDFWFGPPVTDRADLLARIRRWFMGGPTLDATIRERFSATVDAALDGALDAWSEAPEERLALIVVLDQLARNLYRGEDRAFAGGERALALALRALEDGDVDRLRPEARIFLLTPLAHSEDPAVVRRMLDIVGALRASTPDPVSTALDIAVERATASLELLERFGRYPYRNAALGRASTPEELAWLATFEPRAPEAFRQIVVETTAGCGRTPLLRAVLDEMELPYTERVVADGSIFARYRGPGPILHHGELVLTELGAALRYIARIGGRMPEDPGEVARIEAWMELVLGRIGTQVPRLLAAARGGGRDHAAEQGVHDALTRLEDRLATAPWLTSERSVADATALLVRHLPRLGVPLDRYPAVGTWCAIA